MKPKLHNSFLSHPNIMGTLATLNLMDTFLPESDVVLTVF